MESSDLDIFFDDNIWSALINNNYQKSDIEFSDTFLLDIIFLHYYFIYQHPQYIIKLGFSLMSDSISTQIKEAMFSSFSAERYAPVTQYEYNWWCNETGKRLSLPYHFFDGTIDLRHINIVDYNLYDRQGVSDTKSLYDTNSLFGEELHINDEVEQISRELYPYYTVFDESGSMERGHVFKKIYLIPLTIYAKKIKDSYSIYGFAYLLYKSQYLNWIDIEFDNTFVRKIAYIFGIEDKLEKTYPESKTRTKAWEIFENSPIPQGLLSEKEIKNLRPSKHSK